MGGVQICYTYKIAQSEQVPSLKKEEKEEDMQNFTLLLGVAFCLCSGFMSLAYLLWKAPKITGLPSKVENH